MGWSCSWIGVHSAAVKQFALLLESSRFLLCALMHMIQVDKICGEHSYVNP